MLVLSHCWYLLRLEVVDSYGLFSPAFFQNVVTVRLSLGGDSLVQFETCFFLLLLHRSL